MNEIFNCRFLTTVQTMSDEDITPSELQQQLSEFISQAKALLCGHEYLEVSDTYDSLVMAFDKVLGRGKRSARGGRQGCSAQGRPLPEPQ